MEEDVSIQVPQVHDEDNNSIIWIQYYKGESIIIISKARNTLHIETYTHKQYARIRTNLSYFLTAIACILRLNKVLRTLGFSSHYVQLQ